MGRGLCSHSQKRFHHWYPVAARHSASERRNRDPGHRGCRATTRIQSQLDKSRGAGGRASLRWSLVGNSVTKPVAGWIGNGWSGRASTTASRDVAALRAGDWPALRELDSECAAKYGFPVSPLASPETLHEFLQYEPQLLSPGPRRDFCRASRRARFDLCLGSRSGARPSETCSRTRAVCWRQANDLDCGRMKQFVQPSDRNVPHSCGGSDSARRKQKTKSQAS